MSRDLCLGSVDTYFASGGLLEDLRRRVAYRSESDSGLVPAALHEYLANEIGPGLESLDFVVQIFPNPVSGGGPFLVAKRTENINYPTILTYGHGDVVGGQDDRWRAGLSPWRLTVEGDHWYGRGTADNKGQHTINLAALKEVIRQRNGKLGYNVTVLMETGEEAGSPGLADFCRSHASLLQADLFIGSDGPRVKADCPTIFLGSRGMLNFSLRLQYRDKSYHSGNWGGVLSNPATVLANAVSTMVDQHGRVLVEAFRPKEIPGTVKAVLADIALGGGQNDPSFASGWGEPGLSAAERLVAWNTLEVLALAAGSADRPVNAIPASAIAHCQLRFVVGTPWTEAAQILRCHLDKHGFHDVELTMGMSSGASRLDVDHPWVAWMARSIQQTTQKNAVILPNLAGSLPNDIFADILDMPTIWIPHSYPACGQHGPDEHLLASVANEGLRIMAGVYWDLSADTAAPWVG